MSGCGDDLQSPKHGQTEGGNAKSVIVTATWLPVTEADKIRFIRQIAFRTPDTRVRIIFCNSFVPTASLLLIRGRLEEAESNG